MAQRHFSLRTLARWLPLAPLVFCACALAEPNSTAPIPTVQASLSSSTVTPPTSGEVTDTTPSLRPSRQGRRGWSNRVRNRQYGVVQASGEVGSGSLAVRFTVREAPDLQFPGTVDSNSPAYWDGQRLVVFNSAFYPVRATGSNLENLELEEPVVCTD